ncbi:MAG: hypothetical protein M3296_00520, partial [Actinomycetota bacterium]|nr:hypothetical protein [Actinomycetota bacterium]
GASRGHVGQRTMPGAPVPRRTAVVSARVRVPAGAPASGQRRSVTLSCPRHTRLAGLAGPEQRWALSYGLGKDAIIGYSARAPIVFSGQKLTSSSDATVAILCRRPDANRSIVDHPRLPRRGERAGRVCTGTSEYLYRSPGRIFAGYAYRGEPLAIQRHSRSGKWTRVVMDTGYGGWLKSSALCR